MKKPRVGDLVRDNNDGEIGLVMSAGPGFYVNECEDYPDGLVPSWKVRWPSIPYVCDLGEDSLTEGIVRLIQKA
jgi:hypothetical protein